MCAGVAGGATRAALTQHFAKKGNAADIAAKEQSQVGSPCQGPPGTVVTMLQLKKEICGMAGRQGATHNAMPRI